MKKYVFFCSNPVNGGTAKVFKELTTYIMEHEEEITVVPCINEKNTVLAYKDIKTLKRLPVYSEEEFLGELKNERHTVKRVIRRMLRNIRYYKIKTQNIKVMRDFLKYESPYGIMVHNGGYVGDDLCNQLLKAAHMEGINRVISVFHNDFRKNWIRKQLLFFYDRNINRWTHEIVTVSEYTKNRILDNSYISKNIQVIHNGIKELRGPEEESSRIKLSENICNVLMIGNFLDNKGNMYYLKAARNLARGGIADAHYSIIGNIYDKCYYEECAEFIIHEKIGENISVYHDIYNAAEYIHLFDFLVVPSLYDESFGLICLEAMASGKPVVAFACGGVPEVITDKRNGLLVPVGDENALTAAMLWMIEHRIEREEMGAKCKEDFMSRFSIASMSRKYIDLMLKE